MEVTCTGRARRGCPERHRCGWEQLRMSLIPTPASFGVPSRESGEASQIAPCGTRWAAGVLERTEAVTEIQTPVLTQLCDVG